MHYEFADIAIRLRINALGYGAYEVRQGEPTGRVTDVTLPGGTRVTLATDGLDTARAQMFHEDGRPLSVRLDLADPTSLASLLHNVDCEIMRSGPHDGLTVHDLAAIDAAAMLGDGPLSDAVAALLEQIRFPEEPSEARPTPRHLALLGALADSDDKWTTRVASMALSAQFAGAPDFTAEESLVRCSALVEALHSNNGDTVAHEVPLDRRDTAWRRVFTEAGLNAMRGRVDPSLPTAWPEQSDITVWDPSRRFRQILAKSMREEPSALRYVLFGASGPELTAIGGDDGSLRVVKDGGMPLLARETADVSVLARAIDYAVGPARLPAPR